MTTNLRNLTNAELLLQIVSAERACPTCHGYGGMSSQDLVGIHGNKPMYPCEFCTNTGEVPILDPKLMRLPCIGQHPYPCYIPNRHEHVCEDCQGRTWVPNPDAWDMKKALHLADFDLSEGNAYRINMPWGAGCWKRGLQPSEPVWDADPKRARLLAVAAALVAASN